ncbi:diaminopimelate epimerase [bacterium]|nr:diaminopimelate epimerase [bacterium]
MVRFFKYVAAGNDFVIINECETGGFKLTKENIVRICDRRFGVGADGILLHCAPESKNAHAKMTIFNSDGSTAEMCGNGIRCFALYLATDCGLSFNPLKIETGNGLLEARCEKAGNTFRISATLGKAKVIDETKTVDFGGCSFIRTGFSTGNPHLVYIAENGADTDVEELWKLRELGYETNVELVTDIDLDGNCAKVDVYERGAGRTLACGTGGAAVANTLLKIGKIHKNQIFTVKYPGGDIDYTINDDGETIISGIPLKTFTGDF